MEAKRAACAQRSGFREDWEEVKAAAMAYCLSVKLRQHPEPFGRALEQTGNRPIVEMSHRDTCWGAKPQGPCLAGHNVLGKLLTELREEYRRQGRDAALAASAFLEGVDLGPLAVNGRPAG